MAYKRSRVATQSTPLANTGEQLTLLGMEITDESDNTTDMQALARKNWQARARRIGAVKEAGGEDLND